jgi:hypothetical protein
MKNQDIVLLVGGLEKGMGLLEEQMKSANKKLDSLPCAVNSSDIEALKEWKQSCNNDDKGKTMERYKGSISLKNALIMVFVTALISVGITLLTSWVATGTP